MRINLPDVLERTKDYLTTLQALEDDDAIEVDSSTLDSIGQMAAEVRRELNGGHPYNYLASFTAIWNEPLDANVMLS